MRFPLSDWIDAHASLRFDLASSGMRGSIPPPGWSGRRATEESLDELRSALAKHLRVASERVFLSHGASEANAWVLGVLTRERRGRAPVARVAYPEYPPLFDTARAFGYRVRGDRARADVAIVSRPRNPEGDLWTQDRWEDWARGTRHRLVDETFLEFAEAPSLAGDGSPGLWTTGTFTKFFGADDVRVGFAVAPPEHVARFARYVGLVSDKVAPAPAAVALRLLRDLPEVRRAVHRVLDPNRAELVRTFPQARSPAAPVFFDRPVPGAGRSLAERCVRASVLVCPGDLFGDPSGVRLCLTRRGFAPALRAYLRVRDRVTGRRSSRRSGV